jgi:hypothetical protein
LSFRKTGNQHVAAHRGGASTQHDDPVDELLAGVEAVGWRMIVPNHAAAALQPLDIDPRRRLSPSHIRKISTTPRVNGKLRKL